MSIKENTIVSTTDKKVTLLQWLKGIEKALKDSTITGIELIDKGSNAYSLKISFEDGSNIETEAVTLLQPIKSAAIENGNLFITLTDGTRIDCGAVGASLGPTIVHGDFSVTDGNANFDGILNANGGVIANSVKSGSFLMPKATDEQIDRDLTLVPTKSGEMANNGTISVNYSHVRNSNGKLSIVVLVSYKCNADFTKTNNGYLFDSFNIYLPASIMSKIFPIESGTATYRTVLANRITSFAVDTATGAFVFNVPNPAVIFKLKKDNMGSNILLSAYIYYNAGEFKAGKTYAWRFEANLIL